MKLVSGFEVLVWLKFAVTVFLQNLLSLCYVKPQVCSNQVKQTPDSYAKDTPYAIASQVNLGTIDLSKPESRQTNNQKVPFKELLRNIKLPNSWIHCMTNFANFYPDDIDLYHKLIFL